MTRRIYPNPPIVEAVIDFRIGPDVKGDRLLDALQKGLGEKYVGDQKKQDRVEFHATLADGAVATGAKKAPHLTFLQSGDGLRLIGCGDGMLSVHVLAPYPGWESFIEQAKEALDAAAPHLDGQMISTVAVRYIDRISLPLDEETSFNHLLTAIPNRPESMPTTLTGFHFVTQALDETEGTLASLTVASAPPDSEGRPVVLYDLTLKRAGQPLCACDADEWLPIVEALHEQQRDIFEESITEKLRETFR